MILHATDDGRLWAARVERVLEALHPRLVRLDGEEAGDDAHFACRSDEPAHQRARRLPLRVALGADEKESLVRGVGLRVVGRHRDTGAHRAVDIRRHPGISRDRRDRVILFRDSRVDRTPEHFGGMQLARYDPVDYHAASGQLPRGALHTRLDGDPKRAALEAEDGDAEGPAWALRNGQYLPLVRHGASGRERRRVRRQSSMARRRVAARRAHRESRGDGHDELMSSAEHR